MCCFGFVYFVWLFVMFVWLGMIVRGLVMSWACFGLSCVLRLRFVVCCVLFVGCVLLFDVCFGCWLLVVCCLPCVGCWLCVVCGLGVVVCFVLCVVY